MPTTTYRTTLTLDGESAQRLRRLAEHWNVSQTEVIRRSLEFSAQALDPEDSKGALKALFRDGEGLDTRVAEEWISQIYQDRKTWRGLA